MLKVKSGIKWKKILSMRQRLAIWVLGLRVC